MKRELALVGARQKRRRGFVLIIVMVLVAMVAFAGFAFLNTMSDEYRAVRTNGDLFAAEQTMASAELHVLKVLDGRRSSDGDTGLPAMNGSDDADPLSDNPQLFQEQLVAPPRDGEVAADDEHQWRFSVVSPDRSRPADLGDERRFRFGLENESARLHLATLMALDAADPEQSHAVLMGLPGMTDATADTLLDWLDADHEPRRFGAERQEYLNQPNPYRPRNGLPQVLDELLLARDVRRSLLLGPDTNRNLVVDPWERIPSDAMNADNPREIDADITGLGWADLLTLYSAEQNVDSHGAPRIDLNQPNAGRLRDALSDAFPASVVDFILLYRAYGPAGGTLSLTAGPAAPSSSSGATFRLGSVADLVDASVAAGAGTSVRIVHSPVTSTSRELLSQLLDHTTTDSRAVVPGRINLHLAPRAVLRAVPGLDQEAIEQIVARRDTLDAAQRETPGWLLTQQILTVEQFRRALPFLTSGGDVFRAQLIAWRPAGGVYRRAEVVFDATRRRAERQAWDDLSAYGAAIPVAQLSPLAAARISQ